MNPSKYVLDAVMSIVSHYAQKGIEVTFEKAKELIKTICKNDPMLHGKINVDEMAKKIQATAGEIGRIAYNEETLSRFLEVPVSDLATITPENFDTKQLYDHVRLEGEFQQWLEEWGYEIELGKKLTGLRGVEFLPDVYGKLMNLHGEYEVCVNFACDSPPPDEDRVFALLGKIEACAEARKSFSYGDIYMIVTPYRFTQGALNAIGLQNEQENYSVFALEGGDIYSLENSKSSKERLDELQVKVRQAEEETRRSKIKRAVQSPE